MRTRCATRPTTQRMPGGEDADSRPTYGASGGFGNTHLLASRPGRIDLGRPTGWLLLGPELTTPAVRMLGAPILPRRAHLGTAGGRIIRPAISARYTLKARAAEITTLAADTEHNASRIAPGTRPMPLYYDTSGLSPNENTRRLGVVDETDLYSAISEISWRPQRANPRPRRLINLT